MNAYIYVFDTLADCEIGFITAELNTGRFFSPRGTRVPVIAIGAGMKAVRSMGGLSITPQQQIAKTEFKDDDILILPGGERWLTGDHREILDAAKALLARGMTVAGICGASMALAESGACDERRHTSNGLAALKSCCPHYRGEKLYVEAPAASDRGLITASGAAPLEFAYEILKKLGVMREDALDAWYKLFKTQEAQYYLALMKSTGI